MFSINLLISYSPLIELIYKNPSKKALNFLFRAFNMQSIHYLVNAQLNSLQYFFFHPDFTVGFGISPNHALRLVGYTTGRDFHPVLKNFCIYFLLSLSSLIVRDILFFVKSTSITLTSTISPTLTASNGCLIYFSVICEI